MPKTKVVNQTERSILLKEGTAGVYRTLCSDLRPGNSFIIKVDPNATYREYWCAVPPDDQQRVVLSSDDCMEYREVHIRLKEGTTTYTWDAYKRRSHEHVKDVGDKEALKSQQDQAAFNQQQDQSSGETSGRGPGFVGKVWNRFKGLLT